MVSMSNLGVAVSRLMAENAIESDQTNRLIHRSGAAASEAEIVLPDFSGTTMLGMSATTLLWVGVLICVGGIVFSLDLELVGAAGAV